MNTVSKNPQTKMLIVVNIIVMCVALYFNYFVYNQNQFGLTAYSLVQMGAIVPHGESTLTVFSGMFLHVGLLHIAINMWSLNNLGKEMEPIFGKWYLPFYFLVGAISGLSVYFFSANPAVGASGAIAGLWGASLYLTYTGNDSLKKKLDTIELIIFLGIGLLPMISGMGHFFGILSGFIFGGLFIGLKRKIVGFDFIDVSIKESLNTYSVKKEDGSVIVLDDGYRVREKLTY